ncbi:MAG: hypothetical protein ACJA16_001602, partial [Akkermansiaceae bacterium]
MMEKTMKENRKANPPIERVPINWVM